MVAVSIGGRNGGSRRDVALRLWPFIGTQRTESPLFVGVFVMMVVVMMMVGDRR